MVRERDGERATAHKAEDGWMTTTSSKNLGCLRALALLSVSVTAAAAQTATARIVNAANAFLTTLDQKQHKSVLFAFDDQQQRARWSNLPTTMVPRAGLSMG